MRYGDESNPYELDVAQEMRQRTKNGTGVCKWFKRDEEGLGWDTRMEGAVCWLPFQVAAEKYAGTAGERIGNIWGHGKDVKVLDPEGGAGCKNNPGYCTRRWLRGGPERPD